MDLPKLIILRHGETVWNTEGRVQGRQDSALTQTGRAQAAAQGRLLQDLPEVKTCAFRILCSPLGRARATATIALRGLPMAIKLDARLQEVSAGDWEGRTREVMEVLPCGQGCLYVIDQGHETCLTEPAA